MSCDFSQLKKFNDELKKLGLEERDQFYRQCLKELAARLLRKVILRTITGNYPSKSGKKGGTLRRGWTAKTEREAELNAVFGGSQNIDEYINSLQITKVGNIYQIEIINVVNYASYVEFGHRTRGGKGWVDGRFMLTISEQELDSQTPAILERKLSKRIMEVFGGAK